jgi:hypothetical protein
MALFLLEVSAVRSEQEAPPGRMLAHRRAECIEHVLVFTRRQPMAQKKKTGARKKSARKSS